MLVRESEKNNKPSLCSSYPHVGDHRRTSSDISSLGDSDFDNFLYGITQGCLASEEGQLSPNYLASKTVPSTDQANQGETILNGMEATVC